MDVHTSDALNIEEIKLTSRPVDPGTRRVREYDPFIYN